MTRVHAGTEFSEFSRPLHFAKWIRVASIRTPPVQMLMSGGLGTKLGTVRA